MQYEKDNKQLSEGYKQSMALSLLLEDIKLTLALCSSLMEKQTPGPDVKIQFHFSSLTAVLYIIENKKPEWKIVYGFTRISMH